MFACCVCCLLDTQSSEGWAPTGSGYLIPGLIRECQQLVELTGDQGDVVLMHPFVMHRISGNPSGRPRFSELRNARGLDRTFDFCL